MSGKAVVLDMVRDFPDDATFGEIVDALALAAAIRRGEEAADAGRVVSHDEVERLFATTPIGGRARTRIDEELIDFIATGPSPRLVAEFRPSEEARRRVADLVAREKTAGLSAEETSELDHYLRLEHLIRLAKARARRLLGDE